MVLRNELIFDSLARFERIFISGVHGSKGMIDKPVLGLICPNGQNDVTHHGVARKSPVVNCQWRCGHVLPDWQVALVKLIQHVGVSHNCLLFKIPDKPEKFCNNLVSAKIFIVL